MSHVIGIDPGITGGVAILSLDEEDAVPAVFPLPIRKHFSGRGNEIDASKLRELLLLECDVHDVDLCLIEHVGNMSRTEKGAGGEQQKIQNGATGMFNFGDTFGIIRSVCELIGWEPIYKRPQVWQKAVLPKRIKSSGIQTGKTEIKKVALSYVTRRFPTLTLTATRRCTTPHKGIVDAVCIAVYARELYWEISSPKMGTS